MSQSLETNFRNIPDPIQREVRQRCGFGCVICGMPLYEYEHMLGWAEVQRHVAEEITLLCDKHHREKTNGLLPVADVRSADANPYNKRVGVSKPYDLHFSGDMCQTVIGSNSFTTQLFVDGNFAVPLMIDKTPLIAFVLMDGHLLLNFQAFNERNELIMRIANNQLLYSASQWDIQLTGRHLVLRSAHREILLDIEFAVPNKIIINRGHLFYNGIDVVLNPEYVLIVNNETIMSQCHAVGFVVGISIGARTELPTMFGFSGAFRYPDDEKEEDIKRKRRERSYQKTCKITVVTTEQ